jgi:hypothetical protein
MITPARILALSRASGSKSICNNKMREMLCSSTGTFSCAAQRNKNALILRVFKQASEICHFVDLHPGDVCVFAFHPFVQLFHNEASA